MSGEVEGVRGGAQVHDEVDDALRHVARDVADRETDTDTERELEKEKKTGTGTARLHCTALYICALHCTHCTMKFRREWSHVKKLHLPSTGCSWGTIDKQADRQRELEAQRVRGTQHVRGH